MCNIHYYISQRAVRAAIRDPSRETDEPPLSISHPTGTPGLQEGTRVSLID